MQRARYEIRRFRLKTEKKENDPRTTVDPAREHPTATGPTKVHSVTIPDTLALRSPSLWGSRATQTSTSASVH